MLHTQLCWWKSQGPKSVWPPWYPPFGPLRAGREHCTSFPPAQFRQNQPGLLRPVELLSVICIILPDTHTGNCTLNTPPATCGEQSPVGRVGRLETSSTRAETGGRKVPMAQCTQKNPPEDPPNHQARQQQHPFPEGTGGVKFLQVL